MKKIALTTTTFGKFDSLPIDFLKKKGYEVVLNPHGRKMKEEEVVELCHDCIGMVAGTEKLNANVFRALKELKVISRCGAGMDNVDLDAAKEMNIKVVNTPDAPTLAVAELTVGLILSLLRKISIMDHEVREARWNKRMGNLLSGKKVGIVGFGRIGQKVGELLSGLGCEICYYDPYREKTKKKFEGVSLEQLLKSSDIVSVHASTKEKILKEKEFKLIKKGAWFINVARGKIVDEKALFEALRREQLAGAAIDTFEKEPYVGLLTGLENIVLTPHVGSYAKEARIAMEHQAVRNLLKALGKTKND